MKVRVIKAIWNDDERGCFATGLHKSFPSVEALPQWIQERYAVLRLLEEREESPLGARYMSRDSFGCEISLFLYIVPQPDDPKWEG